MDNKNNIWTIFWQKAGKVLNTGWKLALVVIGFLAACLIVSAVWEQKNEHCGDKAHYWDRDLSKDICVHVLSTGDVRIYDREAKKYISPRFKWVASVPQRDSLTVFCDMEGLRGFLNVNTGEIAIESKYEHAWVFSEGLAAVVEPGMKMGFIDATGKYVIEPRLDYIASHDYVFKHGVCCIGDSEGKLGLLSREGCWALPQAYSFIDYVQETDMFIPRINDKDGLLRNGSFEWVYQPEYDDISWIGAPAGNGFVLYRDFTMKHVSVDGEIIDPFLVDGVYPLKYKTVFHSDEADEYAISDKVVTFEVRGLWGVMDKYTGKVLVPAMYGDVNLASENIIQCHFDSCGYQECVLYDIRGNKIE